MKKETTKREIDVFFWFYDDGKNFVPLVVATNDGELSKDEQTCIQIMQAGGHVKKQKAKLLFD